MQDVLGGDGFAADARIGEGHVLGNAGIEVMADHQHVQVLIHGVDRVRPGRIGGGGQHVRLAAGADDVGSMTPAGTFGVIGVNRPTLEGRQGILDKAGFVERVSVNRHLHVVTFGHAQTAVDCRRRGAPVLVQFQAHRPGFELLLQRRRAAGVALAEEAQIDR